MTKPMSQFLVYVGSLAVMLMMSSCSKPVVNDSDIIATWGDTAMTVEQFKAKMYVRFQNEARAKARPYVDRVKIIEEYLVRDLKLLEGQRLGFADREDIRKSFDDAIDRSASDMVYNEKVRNRFITDDMLRDFWEHSRHDLRVRHLLIEMEESVKGRDTLEYWNRVNDLWKKAKGGRNFKRMIDKYSDDSSIDTDLHGDLGYFYWGKMVDEFEQAAWALDKPGDISPPVRTRYGYHIIQLIDKRSAGLEVHTSHILVNLSRRASSAETTLAWERATLILKEAQKTGADFAQLAQRYSEDRKTWNSGEVGWVGRGTMPEEYWEKAYQMANGAVDGPARTYKGYHIIKVNESRDIPIPMDDPDFQRRMYSRLSRIYSDELEVVSDQYLDSVKIASGMKYDQKVMRLLLKKLNDTSIPSNMNRFSAFTAEERELNIVNDNQGGMTIQTLVDRYGDHRFPPQYQDSPEFIEEMVEALIVPQYLAQIARTEGYMDRPEIHSEGVRALNNSMLPEVERELIYNRSTPTEDEIQAFYKDNIEKYTNKAKATVYEIQVAEKSKAVELLGKVKDGEDITKLARRYTLRKRARNRGGRLGPFAEDKYGAVSKKAFELEPDEIAGPLMDDGKFSVIKLISKVEQVVKPLDEVRKQVESDVRFQKQKDLKDAWEVELRKTYKLDIDYAMLKNVWPVVEQISKASVDERKKWDNERGDQAKRIIAENQIQLKLRPGTTQEFKTKDGKNIQVKIGQPVYKDKDGNVLDSKDSKISLTPKGQIRDKSTKSRSQIRIGQTPGEAKPMMKVKAKPKDK